jgi:CDP-diacylglycerol--glycerol-3-phosphate 3-phosphatidyltransferase
MTDLHEEHPARPEDLTTRLRRLAEAPIDRIARGIVWLGLGPNALTITGFLLATASALLAAQGRLVQAGIVYGLGSAFDSVDGAVARVAGKVTRFGALLDSTLDRYGEGALLVGLAFYMAHTGRSTGVVLVGVSLLGSLMVSYVRARSEGLGIENRVGLLTRVERVIVTLLALLTRRVMVGLWVLAIFTHVTVVQRVWAACRATRDG